MHPLNSYFIGNRLLPLSKQTCSTCVTSPHPLVMQYLLMTHLWRVNAFAQLIGEYVLNEITVCVWHGHGIVVFDVHLYLPDSSLILECYWKQCWYWLVYVIWNQSLPPTLLSPIFPTGICDLLWWVGLQGEWTGRLPRTSPRTVALPLSPTLTAPPLTTLACFKWWLR